MEGQNFLFTLMRMTEQNVCTGFWVLKPNYRGLGTKPPAAGGNRRFCSVLIIIPHFEAYLSLNFEFLENFFLSL